MVCDEKESAKNQEMQELIDNEDKTNFQIKTTTIQNRFSGTEINNEIFEDPSLQTIGLSRLQMLQDDDSSDIKVEPEDIIIQSDTPIEINEDTFLSTDKSDDS